MITPWWDWYELEFRKRLYVVAGVSYHLRYYVWWIHQLAAIRPGEYYEYAYPHWGTFLEYSYYEDDDRDLEWVNIPTKQIRDSLYPLG
ncbi:unnamed protein product [Arctia plantaginis]|nr:unnamed protein product [Arctia plantaginis]